MRWRVATAFCAFALIASFVVAGDAKACSCVLPDEGFVRRADAAVTATLVEVRPVAGDPGRADFDYLVKRVFKGQQVIGTGQLLSVRGWLGEAGCGLPEHLGRRYGLFLDRRSHRWRSNLCQVVSPAEMKKLTSDRRFGPSAGSGCS